MMMPDDLKYTKDHEWVRIEGSEAVLGITEHAQSELGDITFIELPETEKEVNQSDTVATIESVKAASDIYAPLSGKIVGVNELLKDAPESINRSPYKDGWICRINIKNPEEQDNLMSAAEYEKFLQGE
ncbi:MAG: glycine cleavage system protein GcvH [Candidatus Omnitrophica bacterium]|nr:glycine cleavage system protein GcvH [Candidatus Omnitrophota bacterium]